MALRSHALLSTLGVWLAGVSLAVASDPTLPPAPRPITEPGRLGLTPQTSSGWSKGQQQKIADEIAQKIRSSGKFQGYQLDIQVENGVAELVGQVADPTQRALALEMARGVAGVAQVIDRMTITNPGLRQTQALLQSPGGPPGQFPNGLPTVPGTNFPPPPGAGGQNPPGGGGFPPPPQGVPGGPMEPTPLFQGMPPGAGSAHGAPPMPPYAWPTYAPHNNYSRVAYPTLYPYQSFPYIGPMYPFPKVPLGWRSVSLTWQDGFWWYGPNATGHDWWHVRYW